MTNDFYPSGRVEARLMLVFERVCDSSAARTGRSTA